MKLILEGTQKEIADLLITMQSKQLAEVTMDAMVKSIEAAIGTDGKAKGTVS